MKNLAAALLTAAMIVPGATPAHAQNLLDMLFGGRQQVKQKASDFPPPPKPVAVRPQKIAPPTFLDYKTATMAQWRPGKELNVPVAAGGFSTGIGFAEGLAAAEAVSIRTEKPIADALTAHYAATPSFLWISGYDPTARALDLVAFLGAADVHGLDPSDYAVAMPEKIWSPNAMADRVASLARFEFTLSAALLRYVQDVEGGRIDPNRMSQFYDFKSKVPDLAPVLAQLAAEADPALALEKRHPAEPEYAALMRELAFLRNSGGTSVTIAPGTRIRPGETNPELPKLVAAIRAKANSALLTDHAVTFANYGGGALYDPALVALVKDWQKANNLGADGIIGPRTIAATVDLSRETKIRRVEHALEKMRWYPDSFGGRYVLINQPAFEATYYDNNVPELTSRTVIGTKTNQTYLFHDIIEYVEFNPTWGVPQSIIINEYLPKLRANPGYLDAKGFEVYTLKGKRISSRNVDWNSVGRAAPVSVIQPGGDGNALGDLKIMFPNSHSIYMHDTPARDLFARDVRAFSHGCVRLEKPHEMAAKVLGISTEVVDQRVKQPTNRMSLRNRLPVYLTYFTAWPDEQGKMRYYDDIYDRDSHLQEAIEKTRAARAASS